ncbi:MAG: type II secretion system protein M [Burkholderiales bacterium]|nr:type II secretion system protein M [Burkholderiales bacterium]
MKESLKKFWMARVERERKILIFASIFILASFLYAFVWQPGQKAIGRLKTELPTMRSKVAEMHREASEVEGMKKTTPLLRRDIKTAIASLAKSSGIALGEIEAGPDGHVHAQFPSISFDNWVSWLDQLGQREHVRLESARIRRLNNQGNVKIDATFGANS